MLLNIYVGMRACVVAAAWISFVVSCHTCVLHVLNKRGEKRSSKISATAAAAVTVARCILNMTTCCSWNISPWRMASNGLCILYQHFPGIEKFGVCPLLDFIVTFFSFIGRLGHETMLLFSRSPDYLLVKWPSILLENGFTP